MSRCTMCGAAVPGEYASCRALFELVCVREGDPGFGAVHLLTVDAYALQHPEEHGPRSNAFHLLRLCRILEHGDSPALGARPPRDVGKTFEREYRTFPTLDAPQGRGQVTVTAVAEARNAQEHVDRVHEWARSVWEAYQEHHAWARAQAARMPLAGERSSVDRGRSR